MAARRKRSDDERDRLALAEHDRLDVLPQAACDLDRPVEDRAVSRFAHRPILASTRSAERRRMNPHPPSSSELSKPSKANYLTVSFPAMPSSAWRGTSQRNWNWPAFLKMTKKV